MAEDFAVALRQALRDFDCDHPALFQCRDLADAMTWWETIKSCAPRARSAHLRWFALNDLYFLLRYLIKLVPEDSPLDQPWYIERCREVQAEPNALDLWSRGSGKSLIKTFGRNIQKVLRNPNVTICILSYVRPTATAFLRWIKTELETNVELKRLFPEVLYENPLSESPLWSVRDGIVVRRSGNYKEATIEARGLLKDEPTSKHYSDLDYDDMLDLKHTSEYMTHQVMEAYDSSLGLAGGVIKQTISGVYFAENDAYQQLIARNVLPLRVRSALDPRYGPSPFSEEKVAQLRQNMSNRNFCLQILLDIKAAAENQERGFDQRWFDQCLSDPPQEAPPLMYYYLLVDPGGGGANPTSRCAMGVLGLDGAKRVHLVDAAYGRMNLTQRGDAVFMFLRQYHILRIGYERYSLQGDVDYLLERCRREGIPLSLGSNLVEVAGPKSKEQRIERLGPLFEQRRAVVQKKMLRRYWGSRPNESNEVDITQQLKNEFLSFPWSGTWDILDMWARMFDLPLSYPPVWKHANQQSRGFGNAWGSGGWMSK